MPLIANHAGEIPLSSSLPVKLRSLQVRESVSYGAMGPFGHILIQDIDGDGVSIQYSTLEFKENDLLQYNMDKPALALHISLNNSFHYEASGLGKGVLHERGMNLNYVPVMKGRIKVLRQELYRHLSIYYKPEHFLPLQESFPGIAEFLSKVEAGEAVQFNQAYSIAGAQILLLIETILTCEYTGALRKIYLNNLAMDILVLAMVQISESHQRAAQPVSDEEIGPIYQVKDILVRDMDKPLSLHDLADRTGMSPYKLNNGFKAVFGMGVTEYLLELRMERAHKLLQEKDMPVSAVAKQSGYAHPNAFTLAFKKYFGYTPAFVQKNGKSSEGGSNA